MSSRSSCVCTEKPKYQEFSDLDKRKESFETWPENCPVSAEQLATAGFWYAGNGLYLFLFKELYQEMPMTFILEPKTFRMGIL